MTSDAANLYYELFMRAPVAYQSLDIEGRLIVVNDAWLTLFGAARDEVIGRFFGDFMQESSVRLMGETFAAFKREGFISSPVFEGRRRDNGESILISVNGRVDRDAAGEFVRTHCILNDVTSRLREEHELHRQKAELEARVLERTAALATARAEAEVANLAKMHFMNNLSHEMRTPLHGILGLAELALRRLDPPDPELLRNFLSSILESGERLHRLVVSLLELVEKEEAALTALPARDVVPFDMEYLVREVVSTQEAQAAKRQQSLIFEVREVCPPVHGDPRRLRQVIEHLIGNACRYSSAGKVVTIALGQGSVLTAAGRDQAACCLRIIDEGCGVPESEKEAIFHPFYQSTRTATGAGGTGLGLALSRNIVRRHGGRLTVENRPEGGAIFELLVPFQLSTSVDAKPADPAAA